MATENDETLQPYVHNLIADLAKYNHAITLLKEKCEIYEKALVQIATERDEGNAEGYLGTLAFDALEEAKKLEPK